MSDEDPTREFEPFERAQIREAVAFVDGGHKGPSLEKRLTRIEYAVLVVLFAIGALFVQGSLRIVPGGHQQETDVRVMPAAGSGSEPHNTVKIGNLRQAAVEFAQETGYMNTRMYSQWSLEEISVREVSDRCQRGEIADAYKGTNGDWRIPWPRPSEGDS